jgi:GNAT superfamily N-acetyltransferase
MGQVVVEHPVSCDALAISMLFQQDMANLGMTPAPQDLDVLANEVVEQSLDPQGRCVMWVARLTPDGAPVGVILGIRSWSLKFGGPSIWIEELYVDPVARRLGVGRLLVEVLLDWAEDNGIFGVDLEAYQGNTPASILYRSVGFQRIGRERFYFNLVSARRL